ncbi:MAG: D-Ala-D-Ala carboxypeptidase family metallohydrolase [Alphaproteobacteria bacterium]
MGIKDLFAPIPFDANKRDTLGTLAKGATVVAGVATGIVSLADEAQAGAKWGSDGPVFDDLSEDEAGPVYTSPRKTNKSSSIFTPRNAETPAQEYFEAVGRAWAESKYYGKLQRIHLTMAGRDEGKPFTFERGKIDWKKFQAFCSCKSGTSVPNTTFDASKYSQLGQIIVMMESLTPDKHGENEAMVTSMFRDPTWNSKKGGESKSMHLSNLAIDWVSVGKTNIQADALLIHGASISGEVGDMSGGTAYYSPKKMPDGKMRSAFSHCDSGPKRTWNKFMAVIAKSKLFVFQKMHGITPFSIDRVLGKGHEIATASVNPKAEFVHAKPTATAPTTSNAPKASSSLRAPQPQQAPINPAMEAAQELAGRFAKGGIDTSALETIPPVVETKHVMNIKILNAPSEKFVKQLVTTPIR